MKTRKQAERILQTFPVFHIQTIVCIIIVTKTIKDDAVQCLINWTTGAISTILIGETIRFLVGESLNLFNVNDSIISTRLILICTILFTIKVVFNYNLKVSQNTLMLGRSRVLKWLHINYQALTCKQLLDS